MEAFTDVHGLVNTQRGLRDSGNGVLYTCIAYALGLRPDLSPLNDVWYKEGVLMRTAENTYGQESHDNYFGMALLCLMAGEKYFPREALWACIKRFGFMQNSFEKGDLWKSQMLRFPHVWALMIAAAFPRTKVVRYLSRTFLKLWYAVSLKFQPLNSQDASGTQLTWLGYYAIGELGDKAPMKAFIQKLKSWNTSMNVIESGYWDRTHPVIRRYGLFEELISK